MHLHVHAVVGDRTSESFVWVCMLKALQGLLSLNANIIIKLAACWPRNKEMYSIVMVTEIIK